MISAKRRRPRKRKVPSTPFTRAPGFATLGAARAWLTVRESAKKLVFGSQDKKQSALPPFLSKKTPRHTEAEEEETPNVYTRAPGPTKSCPSLADSSGICQETRVWFTHSNKKAHSCRDP
ncbi:hypothetical protein Nepgr_004929 [Nepenthes gracilis]|uniref:Uncharacterized protein n=1 Tax=Nepenthes gracilis TaxID=150966 RepID=A0AAD3XFT7_NEPGR|nr:hypothetical protein Nepgr_004929 [Nepenthes gracilis]